VALNEAGEMVQSVWSNLPQFSDGLELDQFVVMPNHVHGILTFAVSGGSMRGSVEIASRRSRQELFAVVHRFKSFTTHEYGNGVRQRGWPEYAGKLWQRDYYERVIRNERELAALREYVVNNPLQWHLDHENPFREG
jgi:REP element-mobilizing transposase RayT